MIQGGAIQPSVIGHTLVNTRAFGLGAVCGRPLFAGRTLFDDWRRGRDRGAQQKVARARVQICCFPVHRATSDRAGGHPPQEANGFRFR